MQYFYVFFLEHFFWATYGLLSVYGTLCAPLKNIFHFLNRNRNPSSTLVLVYSSIDYISLAVGCISIRYYTLTYLYRGMLQANEQYLSSNSLTNVYQISLNNTYFLPKCFRNSNVGHAHFQRSILHKLEQYT